MAANIIETSGLTRSYGDICALKPLDLQVAEGDWLSVMGHSGSGKSTLLNMIGG
jgi:putative ABC transport system ATP-binding protein